MNIETEIALIKKDLENGNEIFQRLDKAIDKLSDVLTAMREVTMLQEQRLTFLEHGIEDLHEVMDNRSNKLDAIKAELKLEFDDRFDKIDEKLDGMSKKVWMIMGAATIIGYLIGVSDVLKAIGLGS
jgi:chromosome segregation ATPase